MSALRIVGQENPIKMYIAGKFWNNLIGDTDDSLTLVEFLIDQNKEEITLAEIFSKLGIDRQNGSYTKTVEGLGYAHSSGVRKGFHFVIDVIIDLAALLLECKVRGGVNLHDIGPSTAPSRVIRITTTIVDHAAMHKALADFIADPLSYDIHELVPENDLRELANLTERLRKELYDETDEEEGSEAPPGTGRFVAFVLLSEVQWNKTQLIQDLNSKWNINVPDQDQSNDDNSLVFTIGQAVCAVGMMGIPVPNGEAVANAQNNFMWRGAVDAATAHKAHIIVAVTGSTATLRERGLLHAKVIAACCRQANATGVYVNRVVLEPLFYEQSAELMLENSLPILNWVWVGLAVDNDRNVRAYTSGLDVLGKDELEIVDVPHDVDHLTLAKARMMLMGAAGYILESDVVLADGETIGFSTDDKHSIRRSPGVNVPGMSLKVSYESVEANNENDDEEMDNAAYHIEDIQDKELPVDEITGFNHLAIYLRWCIEHDMMGESFVKEHAALVTQVKENPTAADLRVFVRDVLHGQLKVSIFSEFGKKFARYYYGESNDGSSGPYFPCDIDDYAFKYFGEARYFSDEFKDEAYLFVPFDESYYTAMKIVMDRHFDAWNTQEIVGEKLPSPVCASIIRYLGCQYVYFPSMKNDDPIISALGYARRRGLTEGYFPVLVSASETLYECLCDHTQLRDTTPSDEARELISNYRQQMLNKELKDGRQILDAMVNSVREDAEEQWGEMLQETDGGREDHQIWGIRQLNGMTNPLILAKIPVKNPWEVFAYLPFGGWNDCPGTEVLMSVSKYWFEKFRAVPVAVTKDELDFALPEPVPKDQALQVAIDHCGFCPDSSEIGDNADSLWQSTTWHFWWD